MVDINKSEKKFSYKFIEPLEFINVTKCLLMLIKNKISKYKHTRHEGLLILLIY